jgi:hypothetical protein
MLGIARPVRVGGVVALCVTCACGGDPAPAAGKTGAAQPNSAAAATSPSELEAAQKKERARIEAEFPLHGLVTGTQLKVRVKPAPDALVLGWLRVGSRIRLSKDAQKTPTCRSGFHAVYPHGYACAGEGIDVKPAPPESVLALNPPARDAPLPYRYFFVKEPKVPEYHRLPSRDEQREVRDFAQRVAELALKSEDKVKKLLAGELPNEPKVPAITRRFLDRGFFVAGAGVEERASRQFVRTVRGSYVKLSQLEERQGSSFRGVELDAAHPLPLAWAVREATSFAIRKRDDGTARFMPDEASQTYARQTLIPWAAHERVGTELLHKLQDGHYLKHWFAAVAEKIERPKGIGPAEPWVHVELEQQTLVLYQGDQPVYATLVSSGLPGHDTPLGLFEIRHKSVASTMSDLGPEAGDDRYSIDDVPWTEYFAGSIALHGAFWHNSFGLRRSHGCVNLSPYDAHRVFNHTWPEVPEGWHGVSTDQTGVHASKVYITEKGLTERPTAAVAPPAPEAVENEQ